MSVQSSDSKQQTRKLFAIWGVLLPLLCAVIFYACCGKITSSASWFHSTFAGQGFSTIFAGEFPAVQLDFLQKDFSDQSLLYHVFLCLTQWLPRSIQLLLLLGIYLGCALFAAKAVNLRARSFFSGSLLFLFLALPLFTGITEQTPDLFAVSALLAAIGIMGQDLPEKQRALRLGALAFLAAWSFPCPQIVLIPALITGLLQIRKTAILKPLRSFAAGACGMFAGLLIHPNPINTVTMWKLYNWDRLLDALSVNYDPLLTDPALLSPSGKEMLLALPVLLIAFAALVLRIRLQEHRGRGSVQPLVTASLIAGWFFVLAFFWVKSALIFAAPPAVLAFLSLADTFLRGEMSPYKDQWKKIARGFFAGSVLITLLTAALYVTLAENISVPVRIGEYLTKNLPEGTPVLNANMQDFPRLYAVAPQLHWQWGTDPVFATERDRQKIPLLIRAAHPEYAFNPRTGKLEASRIKGQNLLGFYGTAYAVILESDPDGLKVLQENGWKILHTEPGEGWILTVQ